LPWPAEPRPPASIHVRSMLPGGAPTRIRPDATIPPGQVWRA
jgi:hypothetical protein